MAWIAKRVVFRRPVEGHINLKIQKHLYLVKPIIARILRSETDSIHELFSRREVSRKNTVIKSGTLIRKIGTAKQETRKLTSEEYCTRVFKYLQSLCGFLEGLEFSKPKKFAGVCLSPCLEVFKK